MEWRTRVERERDLLAHSLADRSAELQLSVNKAEVWCDPTFIVEGELLTH